MYVTKSIGYNCSDTGGLAQRISHWFTDSHPSSDFPTRIVIPNPRLCTLTDAPSPREEFVSKTREARVAASVKHAHETWSYEWIKMPFGFACELSANVNISKALSVWATLCKDCVQWFFRILYVLTVFVEQWCTIVHLCSYNARPNACWMFNFNSNSITLLDSGRKPRQMDTAVCSWCGEVAVLPRIG